MNDHSENQVVVTDVRIPFWSMVFLLVKVTIAAIPASIIVFVIAFFVLSMFGGL